MLLNRLGLGLTKTWLTFWLKKSKMLHPIYSLAARVCRNFKSIDLKLKLLERETATKKATAGPIKISSTVINSAQLRAQRAEKKFLVTPSAARRTGHRPRSPRFRNALQNRSHRKAEIAVYTNCESTIIIGSAEALPILCVRYIR